ncbi:MAG: phage tail protein [Phormidesmis sp. CAN_BIN36]|nr:phage tail protein [Phormidesmis sp. CAN_BIN36]
MAENNSEQQFLNYVTANRFYIEMESNIAASFSECSGISVKVKKETLFEGGVNNQQRIVLGQAEYSDVTLKRGMTDDLGFWNWMNQTMTSDQKKPANGFGIAINAEVEGVGSASGTFDLQSMSMKKSQKKDTRRRNVNILLFNQAGETMQCWTLIGAVPIGWKAPALQASSNTVAIEELTLAYEGLQVLKSGGGGANNLTSRDTLGFHSSY